MQRKIIHICLILLVANNLFSQKIVEPVYEYPSITYSLKSGLSQNQIKDIKQDKLGFLWLINKEGIELFDGLEFTNYKSNVILRENSLRYIEVDFDENVWFSGHNMVGMYDYNEFNSYYFSKIDSLNLSLSPPQILVEKDKSIKLIPFPFSEDNLALYSDHFFDNQKNIFPSDLKITRIAHIINTEKGSYIVGHDDEHKYYFFFYHEGVNTLIASNDLNQKIELHASKAGSLTFEFVTYPRPTFIVYDDREFYREFVIGGGTYKISDKAPEYSTFNMNILLNRDTNIFSDNNFFASMSSAKNQSYLYLGTEKGLIKIVDNGFRRYPIEKGMMSGVWSILERNKEVFFSSYNEMKIIKLETDTAYKTIYETNSSRFYPGATKRSDGTLLFSGSPYQYQYRLDGKVTQIRDTISNMAVNYYLEVDSLLYVATNGLKVVLPDGSTKLYSNKEGLDINKLAYIETLCNDKNGGLWLGSHSGLSYFDGNTFENYYVGQDIPSGVMAIEKDYKENLWFGTHRGILFYDYTDTLPRVVNLPNFVHPIKFIEFIDTTDVLFGSSGCLYLLDLQKFYEGDTFLYPIDTDDGFNGEECLQNASMKDSNGNIWIGTTKEVLKFQPKKFRKYTAPTEPHFLSTAYEEVASNYRLKEENIPFMSQEDYTLTIEADDRNLRINFFTINHEKPNSITYKYKLNGYDRYFSPMLKERFARYNSLPVREYRFELQTCLFEQCTASKSIKIVVKPSHWYQSWWVMPIAGFSLLFGVIFTLFQVIQRRKEGQKLLELELQQLKSKSNLELYKIKPHFTFNVLTAIAYLVNSGNNKLARKYIAKFGNLYRSYLEGSKNLLHSLEQELSFTNDYLQLEKLRFYDKFEYEIIVDETVDMSTNIPYMLIQSFANNAVKHGIEGLIKDGYIRIMVSQFGNYTKIIIEDNGQGISLGSQIKKGKGLISTDEILAYLNIHYGEGASYTVENKNPKNEAQRGTKITIQIRCDYPLI